MRHRGEATQRALVRLKVREALVRSRVNLINSVRFLLKSLGVFVSSSIKAMAFTRKVREQLAPADAALVAPLLAAIDALNAQSKALDAELETLARETYPATERLRQIPGVGPLTALCFVLTVESPAHFAHARAVGPYLGLVPRRDQSGRSTRTARPIDAAIPSAYGSLHRSGTPRPQSLCKEVNLFIYSSRHAFPWKTSEPTRGLGPRFRTARVRSPRPFHSKKTACPEPRAAHL